MARHKKESSAQVLQLFRQHLKDAHRIDTSEEFSFGHIEYHLKGAHTLIPLSVFSNKRLSVLETAVKYLRENEQLTNQQAALMLRRSPASVWITYRNASSKMQKRLQPEECVIFVPTEILASQMLSALEGVSLYLYDIHNLSYHKIGAILKRDERTIWTVCNRARKKLGR